MRFMLKFVIPITARLKLRKWPHHTCYTPQGVHNHAKNVPLVKPSMGWAERETEFWLCFAKQSTAEDERLQRSPGRENDTLNWDQRYQSVYLEWQGNSHFSGAFSFWDKGLASLLFNIHSPSDYDVKHGSPNLSYCTKGKNSGRWLVLITPQFKRCSSPKGRSRAHLVNQVHVRLRVAVNTEPRDIGREPRTVPKTLSVVDALSS